MSRHRPYSRREIVQCRICHRLVTETDADDRCNRCT